MRWLLALFLLNPILVTILFLFSLPGSGLLLTQHEASFESYALYGLYVCFIVLGFHYVRRRLLSTNTRDSDNRALRQ